MFSVVKEYGRLMVTKKHIAFYATSRSKWIIPFDHITATSSKEDHLTLSWKMDKEVYKHTIVFNSKDTLATVLEVVTTNAVLLQDCQEKHKKAVRALHKFKEHSYVKRDVSTSPCQDDSSEVDNSIELEAKMRKIHPGVSSTTLQTILQKKCDQEKFAQYTLLEEDENVLKSSRFLYKFKKGETVLSKGEVRKVELLIVASGSLEVLHDIKSEKYEERQVESKAKRQMGAEEHILTRKVAKKTERMTILIEGELFNCESLLLGKCNPYFFLTAKEESFVYLIPRWYLRVTMKLLKSFLFFFSPALPFLAMLQTEASHGREVLRVDFRQDFRVHLLHGKESRAHHEQETGQQTQSSQGGH